MKANIKDFLKIKEMPILLVLIGIALVITIVNPSFITIENLLDLFRSNITLAIMTLGMLLVIITGGIDVSVGSMISALTCINGWFLMHITANVFLTIVVTCLTGALMGLVNGMFVSRLKIPPIVTTLGTMSIILGLTLYITNGNWMTGIPDSFIEFGQIVYLKIVVANGRIIGFPVQGFFLAGAVIATWFILKRTVIGRGIYAIGGNLESAERMGFRSATILAFVYAYEGLLIGLAAVNHTSIMRQVDPNAFLGFEMKVIAAVVLGGASTLGGTGSILGTMLGVGIFCVINNGLILMKIPTFWQKIVVGVLIIGSIAIDMAQKRRAERKQIRVDVE
jgi:ribose/xylose/arabinose/galactoside ABC-type transport system permease subunit